MPSLDLRQLTCIFPTTGRLDGIGLRPARGAAVQAVHRAEALAAGLSRSKRRHALHQPDADDGADGVVRHAPPPAKGLPQQTAGYGSQRTPRRSRIAQPMACSALSLSSRAAIGSSSPSSRAMWPS